jgi:hypothetical protein
MSTESIDEESDDGGVVMVVVDGEVVWRWEKG